MAKRLFPVVDVPEIRTPTPAEERKYKPSVYFDYRKGDFKRDGAQRMTIAASREAYRQWCIKTVVTERFERLAYSGDIGTELHDALKMGDREATKSAMRRTITEALMVDPRTEYVRGFEFAWGSGSVHCLFTVKGKGWTEMRIGMRLPI